jgi:hypothetical protein
MMLGALSASGGSFTPLSISGLDRWYRADTLSSGVPQDKSGNGNHCTQATAGKRGTPGSGGLNGKSFITMDGTQAWQMPNNQSGAKTSIHVVKFLHSVTVGEVIFSLHTTKNAGSTLMSELVNINFSGFAVISVLDDLAASATVAMVGHTTDPAANASILLHTYNGGTNTAVGSYTMSLNGTSKTVVTSNTDSRGGSDFASLMGRVNAANAVAFGCKCDWYESIFYNRVLTSLEQSNLITLYQKPYFGIA